MPTRPATVEMASSQSPIPMLAWPTVTYARFDLSVTVIHPMMPTNAPTTREPTTLRDAHSGWAATRGRILPVMGAPRFGGIVGL